MKLNENFWTKNELSDVQKYLPTRVTNLGSPPSLATYNVENIFKWSYTPDEAVYSKSTKAKLMGLAIECAIVFFFENFSYTLGGGKYSSRQVVDQLEHD